MKKMALMGMISMIFTTACAQLPSPTSLIQPPRAMAAESVTNLTGIAQAFLPKGGKLYTPPKFQIPTAVQQIDFDGDGVDELFVTWRKEFQVDAFILKKQNNKWQKVWELPFKEGIDFEKFQFVNVANTGKKTLLIAVKDAGIWGKIFLFEWNGSTLVAREKTPLIYSTFELVEGKDGKAPMIATWVHDTGDAYFVYLWKYQEDNWVNADSTEYFKHVVDYYNAKAEKPPYVLYHLADAQIKAGLPKEAEGTITTMMAELKKLNYPYPSQVMLDSLVARVNVLLGNYDEAMKTAKSYQEKYRAGMESNPDELIVFYTVIGDIYAAKNDFVKAKAAYQEAVSVTKKFYENESSMDYVMIYSTLTDKLQKLEMP